MSDIFDVSVLNLGLGQGQASQVPPSSTDQFGKLAITSDTNFSALPSVNLPNGLPGMAPNWQPVSLGILSTPADGSRPCIWGRGGIEFSAPSGDSATLPATHYDRVPTGVRFFVRGSPEFRGLELPTPPTTTQPAANYLNSIPLYTQAYRYAGGFDAGRLDVATGVILHPTAPAGDCVVATSGNARFSSSFQSQKAIDFSNPSPAGIQPKQGQFPAFWDSWAAASMSFLFAGGTQGVRIWAGSSLTTGATSVNSSVTFVTSTFGGAGADTLALQVSARGNDIEVFIDNAKVTVDGLLDTSAGVLATRVFSAAAPGLLDLADFAPWGLALDVSTSTEKLFVCLEDANGKQWKSWTLAVLP
jgi:hypothetical protein